MNVVDKRSQSASVSVLFLSFLFPVLLLSFWFALDVYRVVLERRVLQKRLDTAGLFAVSYETEEAAEEFLHDSIQDVAPKDYSLNIYKEKRVLHSELEIQTSIPFLSLLKTYHGSHKEGRLLQRLNSTIARQKPEYLLGISRSNTSEEDRCFHAPKAAALRLYSMLRKGERRKFSLIHVPYGKEGRFDFNREQLEFCRATSLKGMVHRKYGVQDVIPESFLYSLAMTSPDLWPPEALLWTMPLTKEPASKSLSQFLYNLKQHILKRSSKTVALVTAVFFTSELLEDDKVVVASELNALVKSHTVSNLKISLFIVTTKEKNAVFSKRFHQSPNTQAVEVALGSRFNERQTYHAIINHHEGSYVQR